MKKICLVIPSLQSGGMERVMSELANYFVGIKNVEVYLIIYGKAAGSISPYLPKLKYLNLHLHFPTIQEFLVQFERCYL